MKRLILLGFCVVAFAAAGDYHLLKRISFGAAEGGREYFDYINVDAAARRAYLAHGTEFLVVNLDTGELAGKVTGLKRDHGVALAPELGRGFISDGDAAQIVIFDLNTFKTVGQIKGEPDADSIIYDPASKRIFVFNGDSR